MIIKNCIACDAEIIFKSNADLSRRFKTKKCRNCYLKTELRGDKHPHWKGGKVMTDSGYTMIRSPEHPFVNAYGYVREHRLVMEKHLGRYLTSKEVVHHLNEIKTDNRIENLELTNQSTHVKNHLTKGKLCSLCEKKHLARGYCGSHYWEFFLKSHRASK